MFATLSFSFYVFIYENKSYFLVPCINFFFYYFIFLFILLCICFCKQLKTFLRIDIIYSFDFDKIFIGYLKNGKNEYITTSEFSSNEVERFILQKNKRYEMGFHLYAILKGNINREILYIHDQYEVLEGLVYILNEKKVKIIDNNYNKDEQVTLGDSAPPAPY